MGGILVIFLGLFVLLAIVVLGIVLGLAGAYQMFSVADEIHQHGVDKPH